MKKSILFVLFISGLATIEAGAQSCTEHRLALQVLGSGGPIADDGRASSGYLIWLDGRARVLIDAGGGVFLRYGETNARIEDLELLALTHLHTDHAADLPALLKGGYFSTRRDELPISGPSGNHLMPSLDAFLQGNFSAQQGSYRYLAGFLDGSEGLFRLKPITLDATSRSAMRVFNNTRVEVTAVGVHHGPIPTLAYLFEIGNRKIAISGDQNLSNTGFLELATNADLVVMPMAIPESAGRVAKNLHATPSKIGAAAKRMQAKQLVISHLMQRSLHRLDANLVSIREQYPGKIIVAEDLLCIYL